MREIKNLLIIFHSKDLDGITSGALLKQAYPNARLQGYDHSEPIDFEMAENVIFADIGFKIDQMYELSKTSNIIWIDHHISALNKYKEMVEEKGHEFCEIHFNQSQAACANVFNWLYPDTKIPLGLQLLSDFDIHKNFRSKEWYKVVLPFQFGMRSICNSVDTYPMDIFTDDDYVYSLVEKGEIIVEYQNTANELACRKNSFELEFQGHKAVCLNIAGGNLSTFDSVYDSTKHDMVMTFYFDSKLWHVSMYTESETVDCSEIARQNGGGGHKKAAGFEIENINDLLIDLNVNFNF